MRKLTPLVLCLRFGAHHSWKVDFETWTINKQVRCPQTDAEQISHPVDSQKALRPTRNCIRSRLKETCCSRMRPQLLTTGTPYGFLRHNAQNGAGGSTNTTGPVPHTAPPPSASQSTIQRIHCSGPMGAMRWRTGCLPSQRPSGSTMHTPRLNCRLWPTGTARLRGRCGIRMRCSTTAWRTRASSMRGSFWRP